jgi:hypothetical protein
MLDKILDDKRKLLFTVSLLVTVGGWVISLSNWHAALSTGAIGGLLLLLGNNVFANMVKNVGLLGTGVTNESDSANQTKTLKGSKDG